MTQTNQLKEDGLRLFQQGDLAGALLAFETAVSHYEANDSPVDVAEMLNNIGVIYRFQKKYSQAHQAFEKAEAIYKQQDKQLELGMTLGNMGDLLAKQKKRDEAITYYLSSAATLEAVGAKKEHSQLLRALSLLYIRQWKWWQAMDAMEQSLTIKPRLGPTDWLLRTMLRFAMGMF